MTTDEIMRLAETYRSAWGAYMCGSSPTAGNGMDAAHAALKAAVDTLVAERDALRTEQDTLRQVIEQQLLNAKPGYVLVPVEPTPEMVTAMIAAMNVWIKDIGEDADIYAAMIAAAPKEPT